MSTVVNVVEFIEHRSAVFIRHCHLGYLNFDSSKESLSLTVVTQHLNFAARINNSALI
jgi:hypothetical protein